MARARNKVEESAADIEAAELAALEAALNGDGDADIEINDADFENVNEGELAAALEDEGKGSKKASKKEKIEASAEEKPASAPVQKATPNATRDSSVFAKEVANILGDEAVLDSEEGALTEEQLMTYMKDVTQVKVREKILNLCHHIMNGRKLTGYTEMAAKVLIAAQLDGCKQVTLADFKKVYEDAGYKPGTVNAQAGQMMVVFTAMGMAKKNGRGILEPNANSVIIDALASS